MIRSWHQLCFKKRSANHSLNSQGSLVRDRGLKYGADVLVNMAGNPPFKGNVIVVESSDYK
jgi:hypothetical protein